MIFETTFIKDVVVIRPKTFPDSRGYFRELTRSNVLAENGLPNNFVQLNNSFPKQGVIRGMHYQLKHPQSKLVGVSYGEIYDVIIDLREDSDTFGKWYGVKLSSERGEMLFVPRGFAHGFVVLSDEAVFQYKCDDFYAPECEGAVAWDDPELGIDWGIPMEDVILSEKDRKHPRLKDAAELFDYSVDYYI